MACRRFLKLKVWLSHRTAGAPEGLSVEASDAAATSRRLTRTSRHIALLFVPDCEGVGEGTIPRQTLFYGDINTPLHCEQDDIRQSALEVIDAEINAFNDLIETYCAN